MNWFIYLTVLLQVLGVIAFPNRQQDGNSSQTVTVHNTTSTSYTTLTTGQVTTYVQSNVTTTTSGGSATTSGPAPTLTAIAVKSGSPLHLQPINAANQRFFVGGKPQTSCPDVVDDLGACPRGDVTAFTTCALAVFTPGGQDIWATPDGTIGYTQAHSAYVPSDAVLCPFKYIPGKEAGVGELTSRFFGATGLQACPTLDGRWQVFLKIQTADLSGVSDAGECIEFKGLAFEYDGTVPAWEFN